MKYSSQNTPTWWLLSFAVTLSGCGDGAVDPPDTPAVVSQLAFTVQPTVTIPGNLLDPAIEIAGQDASGKTMSGFNGDVTLALGANPGGATLSGTTTVSAVGGLAVFSDLSIDRPGSGYTLTASASGLAGATSAAFEVDGCSVCWETQTLLPTPREGLAVGVVDGVLYAVGGANDDSDQLAVVEAYDPETNTWATRAPMPRARHALGIGVVNGILYAVGGQEGGVALNTVEAYDPSTDSWTTKSPMPTPRVGLGVAVVNGVLYAVGGWSFLTQALATVEAYDPATDTWTPRASMPAARLGLEAAAVNGILYAIGGGRPNVGTFVTVEAYDPATDSWTTRTPMSAPGSPRLGVLGGVIYAVGADEVYHPGTNSWTAKAPLPTERGFLAVGVLNGGLYVVGGYGDGGYKAAVLVYFP